MTLQLPAEETATENEVVLLEAVLNLTLHFQAMGQTMIAAAKVVEALIHRVEKLEEKLNQ
jgi:hypothetical protein